MICISFILSVLYSLHTKIYQNLFRFRLIVYSLSNILMQFSHMYIYIHYHLIECGQKNRLQRIIFDTKGIFYKVCLITSKCRRCCLNYLSLLLSQGLCSNPQSTFHKHIKLATLYVFFYLSLSLRFFYLSLFSLQNELTDDK